MALPLEDLAQLTSLVVLVVFALVNVALAVLKTRQPIHTDSITVPIWIPIVGFIVSAIFVLFQTVEFALQLF